MRYIVTHKTSYAYSDAAPVCHNLVHLAPRAAPRQTCLEYALHVSPDPAFVSRRLDIFGNLVEYFSIEGAFRTLQIVAESKVEVAPLDASTLDRSAPWEDVVAAARIVTGPLGGYSLPHMQDQRMKVQQQHQQQQQQLQDDSAIVLEPLACQFTFPSPRIMLAPEVRDYATPSFARGRPVVDALRDLSARIHGDFDFDPRATTVHTPVVDVLRLRRGVCQDFAHLAVACARAMGVPARYVSGYLRTTPPPGRVRLVGADASHAWASAWCAALGWVDFDPTNDCLASDSHLTVAWGRDYGDVCPIQGVFVGGGDHTMSISVDVVPQEPDS